MVGRLLYLQATRPNITYAVNVLSQFVADPRQSHLEATHRMLRYLKATPRQGVLLPNDGGYNLRAYSEAEYRSMASTVSEVLWMRWILSELDAFLEGPTLLFCDNQAARHIANNSVFVRKIL
ncbi:secreted RxLR effector protein 161-like protein [Tanacetum coccineum]